MEPQPAIVPNEAATRPEGRRCRRRAIEPGGARPSDVLVVFFGAALTMLLAAAAALIASVIDGAWWLHWLALHLALLGGISQLILGAGQFFVCAFLATTPPSRRLLGAQLTIWNVGTVLVAVGVPAAAQPLVDVGGGLIVAGLVLFAGSLRAMEHRSLQRARWAVRWYQMSASCLAAGALVGVLLAGGTVWRYGSLLGAHLALNLVGWLGTAIIGTLHTFFPSLTGTQLRFERLQGPVLQLWLLGVLALAFSAAFSVGPLAVAGWLALTAAAILLAVNIVGSLCGRTTPLSLPARLVTVAHCFLLVGLLVALIAAFVDGAGEPLAAPIRPVLAALLLAGWVGLTVAGALLHLMAVLARVRHFTTGLPVPRPLPDLATTAICVGAVVTWALAGVHGLSGISTTALGLRLLATVVVLMQILTVARRAARVFAPGRARRLAHAHPAAR